MNSSTRNQVYPDGESLLFSNNKLSEKNCTVGESRSFVIYRSYILSEANASGTYYIPSFRPVTLFCLSIFVFYKETDALLRFETLGQLYHNWDSVVLSIEMSN